MECVNSRKSLSLWVLMAVNVKITGAVCSGTFYTDV